MDEDTPKFHASPELWAKLKPLARQMRHEPTAAEDALWQRVRGRHVQGAKFRRQYVIERFVVDCVPGALTDYRSRRRHSRAAARV